MSRKIIGILGAVLLATVGTFALVGYVQSAKDEAVAGEKQVDAYVVAKAVPRGASLDQIRDAVKPTRVPAKVRPEDAVTDLADLDADLVARVDLAKDELLLRSRLVSAESLARANVPEGYQELSIALDPERAVGGAIKPGDTVGVVLSFEPFDKPGGGKTPNVSHLVLHKVRVTAVQYDQNESAATTRVAGGDDDGDEVGRAPRNQLIVTLALKSPHVEQVVFAAEFGHIWLTAEPEHADESGTRIVTLPEAVGGQVPGG